MSYRSSSGRTWPVSSLLLAGLILLAFVLRFYRLGAWSFADDEIFTLRDSLSPTLDNPRPLLYFLNFFLVRPLMPMDELGMRVLPAIFGVLAIPVFYFVSRRLIGTRAALFGAFLLAVNNFHIYQSSFARYWSLVFLLSAVYPFAIYLGIRDRSRGALALGVIAGVLAVLAHPVAVLPMGGLLLFYVLQLRHKDLGRLWGRPSVRWAAFLTVVLAAVIALRYVPVLRSWIFDRPHLRLGDHLLRAPTGLGVKQIAILLGYVEGLTLPVALAGVVGIYILWRARSQELALLLSCLLIAPVSFILLLSFRTAVSTTYLVATVPILFMGAGVFMDRLIAVEWGIRPRWLLPGTLVLIMLSPSLPTLLSQYRDGRRADFRGAARWLDVRLGPQDVVYSDQYRTLTHYLPEQHVDRLEADPAPLIRSMRALQQSGGPGSLWIVAPVQGGVRSNAGYGLLKQWLYDNCQLRKVTGKPRLDFRKNELHIFRCAPAPSGMKTEKGKT
ncbi:MAG TPA: glycosyltransferase family 39 protein [Gemmatimonadales bacterium]|nr:glycosyltransferase family 39 protein [Gemmatimonadales bacterium]